MIATIRPQHAEDGLKARGLPAVANSRGLPMSTLQYSTLDPYLANAPLRRPPRLTTSIPTNETTINDVLQSSYGTNGSQQLRVKTAFESNYPTTPISAGIVSPQRHGDYARRASDGGQVQERSHRHQASKKKGNGVLGFLTLKEPSTSALEEFAEHERRKAAQKGAKSIATVIPGVSSQKLPDHVPKVNSRWDGLPENARRKPSDRKEKDTGSPLDLRSFSLGRSMSGRRSSVTRQYGNLSSHPSMRKSQDKKRVIVEVTSVQESTTSLPSSAVTQPASRKSSTVSTPSPPPALEISDFSGYAVTSPEASPRTPALELVTPVPMYHEPYSPAKTAVAPWLDEPDDVTVRNVRPDVLAVPRTRLPSSTPQYCPVVAPVIGPAPVPRSPRNVPNFTHSTTPSFRACTDGLMPPPSPASMSSGSSDLSAQWSSQPKERLSLGPQIRKEQVLPWETFDAPVNESNPRSASIVDANKTKRFSYRLGRK